MNDIEDITDNTAILNDLDKACATIKQHKLCDRQCRLCPVQEIIDQIKDEIREALNGE